MVYSTWYMAVSKIQGPYFGSPYYKDHYMFGSILGPLFMETPMLYYMVWSIWHIVYGVWQGMW